MLPSQTLLLSLFGGAASAANLLASHYSEGTINYLSFNEDELTLSASRSTNSSGNALPSWITYDGVGKTAYVPDETFEDDATEGTLVSYAIGANNTIVETGKGITPIGVVATTLYGGADGRSFIANAHYHSAQLTTFKLPLDGGAPLQTLNYTGSSANPNRQEAPHPHHVVVDPTGDFIMVIDLGSDLIRIHKIDKTSGKLTECPSVAQAPGTGPRHGAFWTPAGGYSRVRRTTEGTMFFVANELTNTVAAWAVSYPSGEDACLGLTLKQFITPYEGNSTAPAGAALAGIKVRDNFLYTSNRNDTLFAPNNSLTQYTIGCDGTLAWTDITDSYGTFPRTFDINKAGDYVAVGDQTTSNVAIVKRDPKTGKLCERVADLRVGPTGTPGNADGLSAVVWAE